MKLLLSLIGFLILLPQKASAIGLDDFTEQVYRPDNLPAPNAGDISAEGRVIQVLDFFINLILYASCSVAVLILVIGGIMYVTSLGQEDGIDRAKKLIKYALYGLLAVFMAYALVTNVINLIYRATS